MRSAWEIYKVYAARIVRWLHSENTRGVVYTYINVKPGCQDSACGNNRVKNGLRVSRERWRKRASEWGERATKREKRERRGAKRGGIWLHRVSRDVTPVRAPPNTALFFLFILLSPAFLPPPWFFMSALCLFLSSSSLPNTYTLFHGYVCVCILFVILFRSRVSIIFVLRGLCRVSRTPRVWDSHSLVSLLRRNICWVASIYEYSGRTNTVMMRHYIWIVNTRINFYIFQDFHFIFFFFFFSPRFIFFGSVGHEVEAKKADPELRELWLIWRKSFWNYPRREFFFSFRRAAHSHICFGIIIKSLVHEFALTAHSFHFQNYFRTRANLFTDSQVARAGETRTKIAVSHFSKYTFMLRKCICGRFVFSLWCI